MEPAKEDGKEKLYMIIKYLKKLRKKRQGMQKTKELEDGSGGKLKGKYKLFEEETGNDESRKKNKYRFGAHQVASKPNNRCRVCKYFESHPKKLRGSKTLFAEHYGLGPGGCPRFMELDISMRREVVKEMKICNRCLINRDPVAPGTAHAGCRITPDTKKADAMDGKIRYHTCNEEECLESFLLCDSPVHMAKNQIKLNKCKEKWKERDIQFSVNVVKVGSNLSRGKKSSKRTNENDGENINEEEEVFENIIKEEEVLENVNKEAVVLESMNNEEGDEMDLKEATKKLRQVAEG